MSSSKRMIDTHFIPPSDPSKIDTICLGSGRFLRSVLVPSLVNNGSFRPCIFQTRGHSFFDHIANTNTTTCDDGIAPSYYTYDVDTVQQDGTIRTDKIKCYGAGTLGSPRGKQECWNLLNRMTTLKIIGIGITEAGFAPFSAVLRDLTELLFRIYERIKIGKLECPNETGRVCILNTDNVPQNGDVLFSRVCEISASDDKYGEEAFLYFLTNGVVFHNSMVDRIVSQREGSDGMIPRAEPIPAKALVIEDLLGNVPLELRQDDMRRNFGVIVRTQPGQLTSDISLKLRVANGTHTALAHVMALTCVLNTDILSSTTDTTASTIMSYLDSFFTHQILPGIISSKISEQDAAAAWEDWRFRLQHAHFGLSTFFITQNGAAKGGIRIGPTVSGLLDNGKEVSVTTAFALACLLRFLTPSSSTDSCEDGTLIYQGWIDPKNACDPTAQPTDSTVTYADNLQYNLSEGWYQFKCDCILKDPLTGEIQNNLASMLASFSGMTHPQPKRVQPVVLSYLTCSKGGQMEHLFLDPRTKKPFMDLVGAVSTLYARMIANDGLLDILKELSSLGEGGFESPCGMLQDDMGYNTVGPLHYRPSPIPNHSNLLKCTISSEEELSAVIYSEVSSVKVIDMHTHLLPPSHGPFLCLWGIDELLTYHYLISEYFITPNAVPAKLFFLKTRKEQADLIWDALFINKTPASEACRGVITTLQALGLHDAIRNRDLGDIRQFYDQYKSRGVKGAQEFSDMVYKLAGLKYAIMTNIPFDINEAKHWLHPNKKEYPKEYKSALRVDPLLAGDSLTVELALKLAGYELTLEGARKYLEDWCEVMNPEYMMASTPHNFVLKPDDDAIEGAGMNIRRGIDQDALKDPMALSFNPLNTIDQECCDSTNQSNETSYPTIINENTNYLTQVLIPICIKLNLPIALKIGAHRNINPSLQSGAGDGIVSFADTSCLTNLCTRFPNVKFLVTFLSRNNQHEACVLASKFRNLHLYGCWWYCNNPSLIEEITKMRVEILGMGGFTVQHSDARVLDQLIYKWGHSRSVIAKVLVGEYKKVMESGWVVNRGEIRRDVGKLFGGSYEDFCDEAFLSTE